MLGREEQSQTCVHLFVSQRLDHFSDTQLQIRDVIPLRLYQLPDDFGPLCHHLSHLLLFLRGWGLSGGALSLRRHLFCEATTCSGVMLCCGLFFLQNIQHRIVVSQAKGVGIFTVGPGKSYVSSSLDKQSLNKTKPSENCYYNAMKWHSKAMASDTSC